MPYLLLEASSVISFVEETPMPCVMSEVKTPNFPLGVWKIQKEGDSRVRECHRGRWNMCLPTGEQMKISYILPSNWEVLYTQQKTGPGADCGSDHEHLIAQFRCKLKKVGKTTRSFRYDLDQIPYYYTVEVRNRFKGLDMIDRMPDLRTEVHDIVQEKGIKTIT